MEPPEKGTLDWLGLVAAARWAGVAPWDLATQPAAWLEAIQMAREVEIEQAKRASHRSAAWPEGRK